MRGLVLTSLHIVLDNMKVFFFFENLSDFKGADKISKTTFRVGGPQSPFSISSSFMLSFVLLPFFLNTKINT